MNANIMRYLQRNQEDPKVKAFNDFCSTLDTDGFDLLLQFLDFGTVPMEKAVNLACRTMAYGVGRVRRSWNLASRDMDEQTAYAYSNIDLQAGLIEQGHKAMGNSFYDLAYRNRKSLEKMNKDLLLRVMKWALTGDVQSKVDKIQSLTYPEEQMLAAFEPKGGNYDSALETVLNLTEEQAEARVQSGRQKVMLKFDSKYWVAAKELLLHDNKDLLHQADDNLNGYGDLPKEDRDKLLARHDCDDLHKLLVNRLVTDEFFEADEIWYQATGSGMPSAFAEYSFMELLEGLDTEKVILEMSQLQELTKDASKIMEWLETAQANPRFLEAMLAKTESGAPIGEAKLSVPEIADAFLDYTGDKKSWTQICRMISFYGVEKMGQDIYAVCDAYELVKWKMDSDEDQEFAKGLKANVDMGTAGQWAENIVKTVTKGTVGGGNYRKVFDRGGALE